MADQELRDKNNQFIGKIKARPDGKLELRDAGNFFKGTYDPKTNETRNAGNFFVCKGNMLVTLL